MYTLEISSILGVMPNRFEWRDIDVEKISEVPIYTGMLSNAKFSCDQYVSGNRKDDSNVICLYSYVNHKSK